LSKYLNIALSGQVKDSAHAPASPLEKASLLFGGHYE